MPCWKDEVRALDSALVKRLMERLEDRRLVYLFSGRGLIEPEEPQKGDRTPSRGNPEGIP
jgi:hypothetical protein